MTRPTCNAWKVVHHFVLGSELHKDCPGRSGQELSLMMRIAEVPRSLLYLPELSPRVIFPSGG
jgi:hypothetical protein